MSGRTGTPTVAGGKRNLYTQPAQTRSIAAPSKETFYFLLQFRRWRVQNLAARIEDDGPLGIQPIELQTDRLADPPFDAVAHHRFADGTRNREADPGPSGFWIAQAESGKVRPGVTNAMVIDFAKFAGTQQANTFRKTGYVENCLSELTVSFFRPRARRREITARPS
jgi:hypothetical protein